MDLYIDIDSVEQAKVTYNRAVQDLKSDLNKLNSSLRFLREEGFEGKAKRAFFDILYADWEVGFKQHISDMEFLRDVLESVATESKSIEQDSNKLLEIL